MKRLLLLMVVLTALGCTTINPGYVGIKVNQWGDAKGVEELPALTGMQVYNPITSSMFEYPVFMQTAQYEAEQALTFNSAEGMAIGAEVSVSYQLQTAKVPYFYVKFRNDDLTVFTNGFLRNTIRDRFNEIAGKYSTEDLYGAQKEKFLAEVRSAVSVDLEPIGVEIAQLGFLHGLKLPEQVQQALEAKQAAVQRALQIQNEVASAEAEARKTVATAQGFADAAKTRAEGDAAANELLTRSVTPAVLEWQRLQVQRAWIEKWDGAQPTVSLGPGAMPLVQLPGTGGAK